MAIDEHSEHFPNVINWTSSKRAIAKDSIGIVIVAFPLMLHSHLTMAQMPLNMPSPADGKG